MTEELKRYRNEYQRKWRAKNRDKARSISRKSCRNALLKNPWLTSYRAAKNRCSDKKHFHYKRYGGRGIKFLMTTDDFKFIWIRDKAGSMKKPSIDRIDPDGDYIVNNCRFLELRENVIRHFKGDLV